MSSPSSAAEECLGIRELCSLVTDISEAEGLARISSTSRAHRQIAVNTVRARIFSEFDHFLPRDQHDPLLRFLHSVGGVIVGRVAEYAAVSQDEAPKRPPSPTGDTYDDLCIVVPGPDALSCGMEWFQSRGYSLWRGRRVSKSGRITQETDFVVGSQEEGFEEVGLGVIIAWGQSGICLTTLTQPVNDTFSILAPHGLHRLSPRSPRSPRSPACRGHGCNKEFTLSTAPTVVKFMDVTPRFLLQLIFKWAVRDFNRCQRCLIDSSLDFSDSFATLVEIAV